MAPFLRVIQANAVRDKNNFSKLCIIVAVNKWMAGIVGMVCIGADGGGPVLRTGSVVMELPSLYRWSSASPCHWNGVISSLSSEGLGQWNLAQYPVVARFLATLNGLSGMNPLIPAALNRCDVISL